jgi:serine/threonine protein kinase
MNATSPNQCPRCGQIISAGVKGLCPNCLAMVGFGGGEEASGTVVRPAKPSGAGRPLLTPEVQYFGDYELQGEIARGGMGVVYRARQKSLNRTVAVKMILGGRLATAADVRRFRTEAEAAANLQHPNIVAIHEVGEHEGQHYFSMDLVDGPTLADLVHQGPMPAGKAAQYVKAIAETVQFAHQRGILHRDLKPSNVLVDGNDRVRVTDFGLAKVMHGDSDLTRSGDVMGSPAYMAPEQAQARHRLIGPPSDVYSLGALLYHLLTGRPPFCGENPVETLRQALDEEPAPPTTHNAKIPADLETICLKCLAKRPEQRYATARDLAEELERFLNYEPILAKPVSPWRRVWSWSQRNPWAFAAGFAALVLMVAGLAYGLYERTRFLTWHLSTGSEPVRDSFHSPSVLFFKALPLVVLLLYINRNAFRRTYGQSSQMGATLRPAVLLLHGSLGLLGILAGMGGLILQIKAWAWKLAPSAMLPMEIAGAACALGLNWLGFHAVWLALGAHESSRFRGALDRSVERDLQHETRRWSVFKLVGFALWLCALVVGIVVMVVGWAFHAVGKELFTGLALMGATGVVALWSVRAVFLRRRLFTHVYAPLAVWLFVVTLALLSLEQQLILPCAGLVALSLCMALFSLFFTGRRPTDGTSVPEFPGSPRRDAVCGAALFIGLFLGFHVVENWRGRHAWERVQAELAGQGESLNYASFLKPPVPADQNVMEHPYMKRHFIKGKDPFPVEHPPLSTDEFMPHPYALADLRRLPRHSAVGPTVAGLVGTGWSGGHIAHLAFTNQPLAEMMAELSRQAGLTMTAVTRGAPWSRPGHRQIWTPTRVTRTCTNVAAIEALDRLAREFHVAPDAARWQAENVLAFTTTGPSLQEILDWYARYEGEFARLEEALERPQARLAGDPLRPHENALPSFVSFRVAAQVYANRCRVHLLAGETDDALKHLRTLRRLTETVQTSEPPTLVEAMVKVALAGLLAGTVEETLSAGLWPRSHLPEVQRLCGGLPLLATLPHSLRGGERASVLQTIDTVSRDGMHELRLLTTMRDPDEEPDKGVWRWLDAVLIPRGWIDQNKARCASAFQIQIDGLDDSGGSVDVSRLQESDRQWWAQAQGFRPYVHLASVGIPRVMTAAKAAARTQTRLELAAVACALERHRAAKETYPESLSAIVPGFLPEIPRDLFDGQPLRFVRLAPNDYRLYSIGWNERDDQGELPLNSVGDPSWADDAGDWVWQGVPR